MSVPNTDSFSFQDVCMEVYGYYTSELDLVSAFSDANGTFDPLYEGDHDSLLSFRNYSNGGYVIPNEIGLYLQYMTVDTNPAKLSYQFNIKNGTTGYGTTLAVRIKNTTTSSAYFYPYVATVSPHTDTYIDSGLTAIMSSDNTIGDSFSIELSLDGGLTWDGIVYAEFSLILNYDYLA